MNNFGERLLEERKKLKLNQSEMAALGGVQLRAQFNYEKDERRPDANYLMAIAAAGADVNYIITGTRAGVVSAPSAPPPLTKREETILAAFRGADVNGQEAMLGVAKVIRKPGKTGLKDEEISREVAETEVRQAS